MDSDPVHDPTLPLALQQRIDCICQAFEDAWKSGQLPAVEQFLAEAAPADQPVLFRELLRIDHEYRSRSGRVPSGEDDLPCLPGDAETVKAAFQDASGPLPAPVGDPQAADGKAAPAGPCPPGDAPTQTFAPRDTSQADARRTSPRQAELPEIPGHEVLEVLGRGGMGMVLRARHRLLERIVAVKMPLAEHGVDEADWERFMREARAAAGLQHPNICTIYEVGRCGDRPYISMAYVEGWTLAQWAKERRPNGREAAEMLVGIARAVEHAHRHGILHRDIKPSNVMVEEASGQPMLMDFGLAKQLAFTESELTHSGQVVGTPAYMAPEQAAGHVRQVGTRSDVYALGAVLYYLLCGRPPYQGSSGAVLHQVQTGDPPPPRRLAPRIHRDLETICLQAMARDPARRYATAGDLADDLARFLAGEAILARCEGPLGKLWRKVRRRPITAATVLALLFSLLLVGYVARRAQQVAVLQRTIGNSMDRAEWQPGDVEEIEALIDRLALLAPDQAREDRGLLYQRLAKSIQEALQKPRIAAAEAARIDEKLSALAARDADAAAALREILRNRLTDWRAVLELQPPFADAVGRFPAGAVRTDGRALHARGGIVATDASCQGDTRLEAEFAAESLNRALGLWIGLNPRAPSGDRGYGFVLAPSPAERGGGVEMVIFRNGTPLRRESIALPPGPWRLSASRVAGRLSFQLNDLPPVEFIDMFPVTGGQSGVFALEWPEEAALTLLRGSVRPPAQAASPLERGDDLYRRNQFADALDEYGRQANVSTSAAVPAVPPGNAPAELQKEEAAPTATEFGQEARYKQSLCLLKLRRQAEALGLLLQLGKETGDRWPPLALCQVWAIRLENGAADEAYAVFETLAARYPLERLRPQVPVDLVNSILARYHAEASGPQQLLASPNRLRNLTRANAVEEFFNLSASAHNTTRYWLCRTYLLLGETRLGLAVAEQLARSPAPLIKDGQSQQVQLWELYAWLLRLQGQSARALQEIDGQLSGPHRQEVLPLLVERARVHAALGQDGEAEKDLDELARNVPAEKLDYAHHAEACLLRGFLLERRGDAAAARQAWRDGLPGRTADPWAHLGSQESALYALLLCALTEQFTTENLDSLLDHATNRLGLLSSLGRMKVLRQVVLMDTPPATLATIVRQACRRPAGRELARQIAFRELPLSDLYRKAGRVGAIEIGRHLLDDGGDLSADQEAVYGQTGEESLRTYLSGTIGFPQVLQLVLAWKGASDAMGWEGVAPALPQSLRRPWACVLGLRYLKLGRPEDAARFFRQARDGATPDSPVDRLARAGQERLKAKP